MRASHAAKPPAAYLGGKRNLSARLCSIIDQMPHRIYVEPFVGMGGVFLRRPRPVPVEVINDLSGDVANLFRVIRRHYEPFVGELTWMINSREEFGRQLRLEPSTLTDIERAVRFLYLQRLTFGGKVEGRTYGVDRRTASRFNPARLRGELRLLSRRLASVKIEQLDYAELIRRYDAPEVLFYLDPPYDSTSGYGLEFGPAEYRALAEQLAGIQGRFLMSINGTAFIRETFARFDVQEVDTTWTVGTSRIGSGQRVTELIIRN